jgi:drug/metabolite transporter (DMT)-like permease
MATIDGAVRGRDTVVSANTGLTFALLAYASYSTGDMLIKAVGRGTDIFVIGFFVTLFAAIPVILARPRGESLADIFRPNFPALLLIRGVSAVAASTCAIFAFTRLPLAEAYALIFLVPAAVTVLSVAMLRETVGWRRWLAVAVGFAGVLVVVRPGFREIGVAHLAGLGVAVFAGFNIVVIRRLVDSEKRIALLGTMTGMLLLFNFVMMLPGFRMPAPEILGKLAAAGVFSGLGLVLFVRASAFAPANLIAPTQYSQIGWAVIFGAAFFAEFPDAVTYAGLGLVAASGLMTLMRERARAVPPMPPDAPVGRP